MKLKILVAYMCCMFAGTAIYSQSNSGAGIPGAQFANQLIGDLKLDGLSGSMSAVIIKKDRVIWANAFGYINYEKGIKADTGTIYRIGSITKTFTATILMQLVEEGKVKLDDAVENFLPEIRSVVGYDTVNKITFRQLASHTSGLNREPQISGASLGAVNDWEEKLLKCIPYASTYAPPGQHYLYSNIGYAMLGLALSRVCGIPYIQMVEQRIFIPLHMNDTFFVLPGDKLDRLALGIDNNKDKINTKTPLLEINGMGYRVPNGGIFSTSTDLAKFVISLMGTPALLTADSRSEMEAIPPGGNRYGLGLKIYNPQNFAGIGHNSSEPGYTAQFMIDKRSDYAVIILRSYNKGATDLEKICLNLLQSLE